LVLALGAGARRPASALDRYTASVGGDADTMLVQPSGRPQVAAIRSLPIVRELHSVTFLTVDVDGAKQAADADGTGQITVSAGDGYAESRVVAGRRPATA